MTHGRGQREGMKNGGGAPFVRYVETKKSSYLDVAGVAWLLRACVEFDVYILGSPGFVVGKSLAACVIATPPMRATLPDTMFQNRRSIISK